MATTIYSNCFLTDDNGLTIKGIKVGDSEYYFQSPIPAGNFGENEIGFFLNLAPLIGQSKVQKVEYWNKKITQTLKDEKVNFSLTIPVDKIDIYDVTPPSSFSALVIHSGGAKLFDQEWQEQARLLGATHKGYYDSATEREHSENYKNQYKNTPLNKAEIEEGWEKAKEAIKALGRKASSSLYVNGLLARNWFQVKNSNAVYAVSNMSKPGEKSVKGDYYNKAEKTLVDGGTGYAIEMAIQDAKKPDGKKRPIYVFHQDSDNRFEKTNGKEGLAPGWYKWDYGTNDFIKIDKVPILATNSAGIGSSTHMTEAGKKAVKDVFEATKKAMEERETLYSRLPNRTVSNNVVIPGMNYKGKTIPSFNSASGNYSGSVYWAFIKANQQFVGIMRNSNSDEHYGNPFDSKNTGNIKTNSTRESVEYYMKWLVEGKDSFSDKKIQKQLEKHESRRQWILERLKSGELKGKPLVYYKDLGEASHATALDYLINEHDWGEIDVKTEAVIENKETYTSPLTGETYNISYKENPKLETLNEKLVFEIALMLNDSDMLTKFTSESTPTKDELAEYIKKIGSEGRMPPGDSRRAILSEKILKPFKEAQSNTPPKNTVANAVTYEIETLDDAGEESFLVGGNKNLAIPKRVFAELEKKQPGFAITNYHQNLAISVLTGLQARKEEMLIDIPSHGVDSMGVSVLVSALIQNKNVNSALKRTVYHIAAENRTVTLAEDVHKELLNNQIIRLTYKNDYKAPYSATGTVDAFLSRKGNSKNNFNEKTYKQGNKRAVETGSIVFVHDAHKLRDDQIEDLKKYAKENVLTLVYIGDSSAATIREVSNTLSDTTQHPLPSIFKNTAIKIDMKYDASKIVGKNEKIKKQLQKVREKIKDMREKRVHSYPFNELFKTEVDKDVRGVPVSGVALVPFDEELVKLQPGEVIHKWGSHIGTLRRQTIMPMFKNPDSSAVVIVYDNASKDWYNTFIGNEILKGTYSKSDLVPGTPIYVSRDSLPAIKRQTKDYELEYLKSGFYGKIKSIEDFDFKASDILNSVTSGKEKRNSNTFSLPLRKIIVESKGVEKEVYVLRVLKNDDKGYYFYENNHLHTLHAIITLRNNMIASIEDNFSIIFKEQSETYADSDDIEASAQIQKECYEAIWSLMQELEDKLNPILNLTLFEEHLSYFDNAAKERKLTYNALLFPLLEGIGVAKKAFAMSPFDVERLSFENIVYVENTEMTLKNPLLNLTYINTGLQAASNSFSILSKRVLENTVIKESDYFIANNTIIGSEKAIEYSVDREIDGLIENKPRLRELKTLLDKGLKQNITNELTRRQKVLALLKGAERVIEKLSTVNVKLLAEKLINCL